MSSNIQFLGKQFVTVTGSRVVSSTDGWTSRKFTFPHHKGCMLQVNRSAEVGTATLDVKIQYLNHIAGSYDDLEGAAIVQMGDGVTGLVYLTVYPGLTGSDADASIALNTVNKHCGAYLPDVFRIVATTTGTSNTFSIGMLLLP